VLDEMVLDHVAEHMDEVQRLLAAEAVARTKHETTFDTLLQQDGTTAFSEVRHPLRRSPHA
jgi:hypothetical protein